MSEPVTHPAPMIDVARPPESKWQREQRAFLQMLPNLLQTHRGKFVAVHEGQVVGSGEDKLDLAWQAYAKFGYVPVYVGLVAERPLLPARMPSFRVLPEERRP